MEKHCRYPPDRHKPNHYSASSSPNLPAAYRHYNRPHPSPPPPAARFAANFVIRLLAEPNAPSRNTDLQALISGLYPPPERRNVQPSSRLAASLFYTEWSSALSAMVSLWRSRLDGAHGLSLKLDSRISAASDRGEFERSLKAVFCSHVKGLLEGELVRKFQKRIDEKSEEIADVHKQMSMKRGTKFANFYQLNDKKTRFEKEKEMIARRLREFRSALGCLLEYLGDGEMEGGEDGLRVLRVEGQHGWEERVYRLIMRECRRLEDGLPIYAYRTDILNNIHSQQITVLIGETGSGKSTQLAQFLADSGIADGGSIVCTQPRKIAAISLAHRVREESIGCYADSSVICLPTYSSSQQFQSKVIYMTDHCLLQHYMNDRSLSQISCIIVDEAHERSLNTDLLLALVKALLVRRLDLRLVIMSATADAKQLSDYFFGSGIFHVIGRNYPVDIQYNPPVDGTSFSGNVASYVSEVVRMATNVHQVEKEGTILAFLTSQMEIEWACENFVSPSAVALPLHGKLSFEEQYRVFENFSGKRKVIFATNIAETSLTIPGVKYVVDCGRVKENKFDPATGMNLLKVCWISQSSANQRAGRAGRTVPGRCYRLYTECDFKSMTPIQEPEIRRVHLGVAVLRILALGIKDLQSFDFVDAPSSVAVDIAVKNLLQLGAISQMNGAFELTEEGQNLVKLGIEPQLGKLILSCSNLGLGKEGVVLAAVMANSSSIFCRVGNDGDKIKADSLKVQFCHKGGDLFTLLSVYQEWEAVPPSRRNQWCWDNSINAKTMRRCQDVVQELENCLQRELALIVPTYWKWNPHEVTVHEKNLKKIILISLSENVAAYSGYDKLGYEVALTRNHVQLHPSCSLLVFNQKPSWVVFGELLSVTNDYLVCVTAVDFESLFTLNPPPLFDAHEIHSRQLQAKVMTGFGCTLLKKFCGKFNHNLLSLVSRSRNACMDERIGIEVNVDQNVISLYAPSKNLDKVMVLVNEALEYEKKLLRDECMEKCLYSGLSPCPVALFGAGAEIKHLELEKRFLTVDLFLSNVNSVDDKELLLFLEKIANGSICAIHKLTGTVQEDEDMGKWGKITFSTPDAAKRASELNGIEFAGSMLKVLPSRTNVGGDLKTHSFPTVKAKVYWPCRRSRGFGFIKFDPGNVSKVLNDYLNLSIGGKFVHCEMSRNKEDSLLIGGIDKELCEDEILDLLRSATDIKIRDFFLMRGESVENPPCAACEEALLREISPFMPKRNYHTNSCQVQVLPPECKDTFVKAFITFDGRLHLEAANALEQLKGKVLPGCLPWQKIQCQQLFHSSLSCPSSVYPVIRKQLDSLLKSFRHIKGADCHLEKISNGSYRVRISANATKRVAELRRPFEELMNGRTVKHESLNHSILQHLFTRDGINLMRSIQQATGTCVLFDRQSLNLRIFGTPEDTALAERKLILALLSYHASKPLEVNLRGGDLPPDLMKEVVKKFGPDLFGLKKKIPGAEFKLNTKRHVISIHGNKELKKKVEEAVYEVARTGTGAAEEPHLSVTCPICLCEVEDGYHLEGCSHLFCRGCLLEQCESAIKNSESGSFPLSCANMGCRAPIVVADLKALLPCEKLEELFRSSVGAFVRSSRGMYRFCPSPDCPSVYRTADPTSSGEPFLCGACYAETCTKCHLEYHPYVSCERYKEYKEDPDLSLKEWCRGKDHVQMCPICGYTIEKIDGCNHVECRCGNHVCWVCLECFSTSEACYDHLRSVHMAII